MEKELFSPMQIDALGEMMNISLGSSATAVSNMLDHRVDITTPKVTVVPIDEFTIGNLEPAIGVEIKYVEGLDGSNIMLLRRSDVKVIVDILMGSETPDEEFELNELTISAVCEVMNQMMGAAATAMSDFLGFPVNISTPSSFELEDLPDFKREHLPQGTETLVVVRFALKIEDALESEFMNILSVELSRKILAGLGMGDDGGLAEEPAPAPAPAPEPAPAASSGGDHKMSQEEIEAMLAGGGAAPAPEPAPAASSGGDHKMTQEEIEAMLAGGGAAPAPEPAPAASSGGEHKMSQEEIEAMLAGGAAAAPPPPPPQPQQPPVQPPMQPPVPPAMPEGAQPYANGYMNYPPMYYPYPYPPQPPAQVAPDPKVIPTQPVPMKELEAMQSLGKEQAENLELIMEVPLQVTVEIGRTQRKVQDILEYTKGSLVVLDKLAGDQVDLFVNGKCIARGDVVVIDDNFGVRITEIVQKPALEALAKK
ncbi:MAG: flagellar motor switch protein FliN [Oscillibacter sp.]|nr:flagellar motor switch protein FliN [Oscillibacter sp.]